MPQTKVSKDSGGVGEGEHREAKLVTNDNLALGLCIHEKHLRWEDLAINSPNRNLAWPGIHDHQSKRPHLPPLPLSRPPPSNRSAAAEVGETGGTEDVAWGA